MPTLTSNQTYMDTWNGHAPALDADGILRNLIYSPRFSTKVAAYTVLAKETGTWFLTTGATTTILFTLPAITAGPFLYYFVNTADVSMEVASETADTLITFNDLQADKVGIATSSEKIGGFVIVGCDGTSVFALTPISAHSQTVTVTTN